jgi:hypothetical protein
VVESRANYSWWSQSVPDVCVLWLFDCCWLVGGSDLGHDGVECRVILNATIVHI